jgi:O-methyltransferase involved in polyketide biosynthesis
MDAAKIRPPNEHATYLTTLYGKALDAGASRSILHDTYAAQAVRQIDFDFHALKMPNGGEVTLPLRAKHLDGWAREFIAQQPRCTVLHLGCGLDSRVFRVDPPASVHWIDIDQPEVIALRQRLYPARRGYELSAGSVTDPSVLERAPRAQPVLVVAEGLIMYLPRAAGVSLFRRICERFPSGQFALDAYGSWTTRAITWASKLSPTPVSLPWGIDDPHLLEREVPRLQLMEAVPFLTMPELVSRMAHTRAQRALYRLLGAVPRLRDSILHLRYRF